MNKKITTLKQLWKFAEQLQIKLDNARDNISIYYPREQYEYLRFYEVYHLYKFCDHILADRYSEALMEYSNLDSCDDAIKLIPKTVIAFIRKQGSELHNG